MIIIVNAAISPEGDVLARGGEFLEETAGESHYSYRVVLESFLPVLEELGTVVIVRDPAEEVDAICDLGELMGERCVFLSFAPPQLTPLGLRCRTIPIFAWEFCDVPVEPFGDNVRNDWRRVFSEVESAIAHSQFAVDAVRRVMGESFPIISCPAPVFDDASERLLPDEETVTELRIPETAFVVDTGDLRHAPSPSEVRATAQSGSHTIDFEQLLAGAMGAAERPQHLSLPGIVYTSVFNPGDARKKWERMVISFCRAFADTPDAVLVLKFVHWNHGYYLTTLHDLLFKLAPFRCRIVGIGGFLDSASYRALVSASTYAVNTSTGEGQCLPLMEFMSRGKPAIAPRHTAMVDYLGSEAGFIVDCIEGDAAFPQDGRGKFRTRSFTFVPDSFVRALHQSYTVAKEDSDRYEQLSTRAAANLRAHCARAQVTSRLRAFLEAPVPST